MSKEKETMQTSNERMRGLHASFYIDKSEPEPTEFTKKLKATLLTEIERVKGCIKRDEENKNKSKSNSNKELLDAVLREWRKELNMLEDSYEACDIIDRLTTENKTLKRPMEANGFKVEGMVAVGNELIDRDKKIEQLQAEIKIRDELLNKVQHFLSKGHNDALFEEIEQALKGGDK